MEFLKTHKKPIIIGAVAFALGFIVGEIWQARSFNQKMANTVFNQITNQQSQMRKSRENSQRKFDEQRAKDEKERQETWRVLKENRERDDKAFQKRLSKRRPTNTFDPKTMFEEIERNSKQKSEK